MKLVLKALDSARRFFSNRFQGALSADNDASHRIKAIKARRQQLSNLADVLPANQAAGSPAVPRSIRKNPPANYRSMEMAAYSPLTLKPQLGKLHDPDADFRRLWLKELVAQIYGEQNLDSSPVGHQNLKEITTSQLDSIFEYLALLAAEFNSLTSYHPHRIVLTRPTEIKEPVPPDAQISGHSEIVYYRGRLSTSSLSLTFRAWEGSLEFFLLPADELMSLSKAELPSRLKLKLSLRVINNLARWSHGGLPIEDNEIMVLLLNLFRELVSNVALPLDPNISGMLDTFQATDINQAIHHLILEKQNLVLKIISQQEEIQNTIARELHDTVISDVMMLKRLLSEDRHLSQAEIIVVLDKLTARLREICDDLAPRDLVDWGLQTVIDDQLQRLGERTGADCSFNCDTEIPALPAPVQLHIYRIVQEALNNIEKYAQASRVIVSIKILDQSLHVTIEDDGKGFSLDPAVSRKQKEGSRGLGSMQERAELISCFCPARLSISTASGAGTTITLEVHIGTGLSPQPAAPIPENLE